MKRILITGGSGFIGTEIVMQLKKEGKWDIVVLDSMSKQVHGDNWQESYLYNRIKKECRFLKGDVTDYNTVKMALQDVEYIIHLAAETGTGQSMYEVNQYNQVNIMGLSNIFQAVTSMGKDSKIKKIVLSSSRSVYGEGKYNCLNCGMVYPNSRKRENLQKGDYSMYCPKCGKKVEVAGTDEDSDIRPSSLYAFTKYAQEMMLKTMCDALRIDYTIFRFQNVYGVGQSLKNSYTGILSIFSSLMLENKPINIFEDGLESRDFVNVIDVAVAVVSSLNNEMCNGEVINIGSGIGTSVIEIANKLKEEYKSNSSICITGDFRLGDIAHNVADITKARELLGFELSVDLNEGIGQFCEWVKEQECDNSDYNKSLDDMERAGMFIRK